MKKIYLILMLLISKQFTGLAQNYYLYGVTSYGGHSQGVIFCYDPNIGKYTLLAGLPGAGESLGGTLVQDTLTGYMYGLALGGGGCIFRYDPNTNIDTALFSYGTCTYTGSQPNGSPVLASNGFLYGMTAQIGICPEAFFSFNPVHFNYTSEFYFDTLNGADPIFCQLLQAGDGNIYGMTLTGGTKNLGVIIKYDPLTNKDSLVHSFDSIDGAYPAGGLIQASNGLLYGMNYSRGKFGAGVTFSFDPITGKDSVLYNFDFNSGGYPEGDLYQASNGKMYGLVQDVFADVVMYIHDPNTGKDTLVKLKHNEGFSFNSNNDLVQDPDNGLLYGTTSGGGDSCAGPGACFGTLFSFDPITFKDSVLVNFYPAIGYTPIGRLLLSKTPPPVGVGIANIQQLDNSIKIYPNPNIGKFTLETNSKELKIQDLEIFDILGEKIYSQQFEIYESQCAIDLGSRTSGVYFYKIISENSCLTYGKFVIQ